MTMRETSSRPTWLASSIQSAMNEGLMLVRTVWPADLRNRPGLSRNPPSTIRSRMAAITSCWRAARVKSLSPALRTRVYASA